MTLPFLKIILSKDMVEQIFFSIFAAYYVHT